MSGPKVAWLEGKAFVTRPPGLCIFGLAEGVTVESGGRLLLGLRLHRPEAIVLLDEVIVTAPGPQGYVQQQMTPEQAKAFCAKFTIRAPDGDVPIGPQLLAALDAHSLAHREAIARGPGLVIPMAPGSKA